MGAEWQGFKILYVTAAVSYNADFYLTIFVGKRWSVTGDIQTSLCLNLRSRIPAGAYSGESLIQKNLNISAQKSGPHEE